MPEEKGGLRDARRAPVVRVSLWGVAAYLLFYGSVVAGTALSSPFLRARAPVLARAGRLHEMLSLGALFASFVHAVASMVSPQGERLRWLFFVGPDRGEPFSLTLGVAALYGAAAVTGSFYLRHRIAPVPWHGVHALAYPAFAAAVWHSDRRERVAAGDPAGLCRHDGERRRAGGRPRVGVRGRAPARPEGPARVRGYAPSCSRISRLPSNRSTRWIKPPASTYTSLDCAVPPGMSGTCHATSFGRKGSLISITRRPPAK